jgi:hypothetical protein
MAPAKAARAAPPIAERDPHVEQFPDRLNETLTPPSQTAQAGDAAGNGRKSPTCKNLSITAKPPSNLASLLTRKAFVTSRLADFASKEQLELQTGHAAVWWPEVILKELVDNSLDECERAGVAPKIAVTVTADSITVKDNGGGMTAKVVKQILNYATKTSSNAAYVSPTRGQQGNALQTLLAMSHALTGKPGVTLIESGRVRHSITSPSIRFRAFRNSIIRPRR